MKSSQPKRKRVALKLLVLLLISVAPLIGALFLYQMRDSVIFLSKNHGTLITPSLTLEEIGVENAPGTGRWLLAYYTDKPCDAQCHVVFEHFSVIEQSLIKDKPRLGTLLLSNNPIIQDTLPKEPTDILQAQIQHYPLPPQLLPYTHSTAIWLIDPLGNIILRYEPSALDNRLLLDLRYLLKVSQIG